MNPWKHIVATALFCCLPLLAHGEDYALWNDQTYDFTNVKTIYVDTMDTSTSGLHSPAREQLIKNDFAQKASALKWKTTKFVVAEPTVPAIASEPTEPTPETASPEPTQDSVERTHVTTADPGANVTGSDLPAATPAAAVPAPAATAKPTNLAVPQAAKDAEADLYVTAQVLSYGIGTGLIPAHTEWNSYPVHDVYYDRDGRAHWFTRYISYPVYVPDRYVPIASVGVRFTVVDVRTGAVVSLSEDTRDRGSSDDTRGVYKRIIDRFFKNLKKEIYP